MTKVFITKADVVTAFGTGLDLLYRGLKDGQSGFSTIRQFDTSPYVSSLAGMIPGLFPEKTPTGGKEAARILTLADHLISRIGPVDSGTLVITASTKGGIEFANTQRKAPLPQNLMVSDLPGFIAGKLKVDRAGFNINAACASSTIALAKAAQMIQNGSEDTILVFAMDLVSEFVFSGFSAIGAMAQDSARPFDVSRQGLTLGEGGAVLMLMGETKLKQTGSLPLAEISGWGIAGDASHLTAPDREGSGLKLAMKKACKAAELSVDQVRVISTHGTGTIYNDAMELTAICDLFEPNHIVAHSIKGAIGHTLGAAGAIEAALCVKLLETRCLPGTAGLAEPEQKAKPMFSSHSQEFDTNSILTTNSGFGGINAALVLREVP